MLMHSMEHIAQRHGMRQANIATIPLIFVGSWTGGCSDTRAIPVGFMAYQRSAELEADTLAIPALARAGFDPKALVSYIQRMQPENKERIRAMSAAVDAKEKLPGIRVAGGLPDEFSAARGELRRLIPPPVRSRTPPSLYK
ncbi:MAG: M48 family metalloprotease [Bryobacteraceae bacterium]